MAGQGKLRQATRAWVLLAPLFLFYLLFLVLPYTYLLRMSFNLYNPATLFSEAFSMANYEKVLSDGFYLGVVARTILIGAAVTLLNLIIGYPLAWTIAQSGQRMKNLLLAVVLSPMLVNLVVRTYGWVVLLGDKGVLNTWLLGLGVIDAPAPIGRGLTMVIIGLAQVTLPLMVLSLVSVMEGLSGEVLEAADSLGSGPWRKLVEVIWPLTLPGVSAGSVLVFCFCTSAFITPAMLGGGRVSTVSTLIYEQFTFLLNWPLGAALVFVLLVMNFAALAVQTRLMRARWQD